MEVKEKTSQKKLYLTDDLPFKSAPTTIGKYLLNKLNHLGVEHIFGIPGDYILKFDKLIEEHENIQFIGTTRENTAGYMADAYARARGLGVACITYGVGINIANATAQALVESVPLIIISGAAGSEEFIRCNELHHLINQTTTNYSDTTQLEIFKQITVGQAVIDNQQTAAKDIDTVIEICLRKKKPIYIEIPRNMVDVPIEEHIYHPPPKQISDTNVLEESVQESLKILQQSKQPVIWLGYEVHRFGLSELFLKFAEKYHIPITSTLLGKTVINEDHPLFIGVYQGDLSCDEVREYVESSDCLLAIGTMLNDVNTGIFSAKIDQKNRIFAQSDSMQIGYHHFKEINLGEYLQKLYEDQNSITYNLSFIPASKRNKNSFAAKKNTKITSKAVFDCIETNLRFGDIIVTDIGDCLFGSSEYVLDKGCFVACSFFATLGFGTPGAIATQLASPNQRVIGIVGDGAFQITCTELSTAVRYGIYPIIIVLNNHGYGTERPLIEGEYNDVLDWDYTALTKVFKGGVGIECTTEEEFEKALLKALQDPNQLYILEVELDKTDFSPSLNRFVALVNKAKSQSN
ncbi:MAG: thiamine pyrophosphate-binding protein [Chlamydiota bacterium]|nr:thiamine pyrophosphate-binding protein [Chlamydiota bacterium]